MKTIWKFDLRPFDSNLIKMPIGAEILYVSNQYGVGRIWALVDAGVEVEEREFVVFGTGDDINNDLMYRGSFNLSEDTLILHVFEVKK